MPRHLLPSRRMLTLFAIVLGFALPVAANGAARVNESYGKLPLHFEANQGQAHEDVRFLTRGSGYSLYLTPGEAVFVLAKPTPDKKRERHGKRDWRSMHERPKTEAVVLRMAIVGADPAPLVSGLEGLSGKVNYFIGNDPAKWRTNVPTYAKVHYRGVYPGIDLVYYGNQRQLEYDFIVAPGADPGNIVLDFQGADRLEVNTEGDLVLHLAGGALRQKRPVIYQEVDGIRREIAGGYVLQGANRVGFEVATYDASRPLIIDPVLAYSTYLGGGGSSEGGEAIAVDAAGNAYVTGSTTRYDSSGFPTTPGAFQTPTFTGWSDAFVTKMNAAGSALVYSAILGGGGEDWGFGIVVDADGHAYVTGQTEGGFPTTPGAIRSTSSSSISDAFVTKIHPTGSALIYSTQLGGNYHDGASGIAVDASGNAYVTGGTGSADFPTTPGAFQSPQNERGRPFTAKLNPSGTALVYSTTSIGGAIAVDADGNAYLTGTVFAFGTAYFLTTPGAFQTNFRGGTSDAYVAKLDATGSALVYSTYLGGSGEDRALAIAIDASRNAYVTGYTGSTDFPTTPGVFQSAFAGGTPDPDFSAAPTDAFVTKLDPTGSALAYSTYLGGSGNDFGYGIVVDTLGNAYLTGDTQSTNFPTTPGAPQAAFGGGTQDVYVTKLNPAGSTLVYSTYLGGSNRDMSGGIAVDPAGNAYVTGGTTSTNFPTTPGAFQSTNTLRDVFVAKISEGGHTVLLALHENGSDGSTTFIDASSSRHTLTPAAQAQWDTAQAPAGLTSSGLFDGDADQIEAASHPNFEFGAGDFTVEFFVRFNDPINRAAIMFDMRTGVPGEVAMNIYRSSDGKLAFSFGGNDLIFSPAGHLVENTWYHIALARANGVTKMFSNGTQVGSDYVANDAYPQRHIIIGNRYDGANLAVNGWMAGVRVTKGVARYASNFTPPALPYNMAADIEGQGTRSEESAAAYMGYWPSYGAETGTFNGGTIVASNQTSATATFTFTGTAVSWIGVKCNVCGIATVSIDGGLPTTVNTFGPGEPGSLTSEPVFSTSGLAPGTHTLTITVTGTTTSPQALLSNGTHIAVDAFDVGN